MFPTTNDAIYHQHHTLPQWAIGLAPPSRVNVHHCINSHASQRLTLGEISALNGIEILKEFRKEKRLIEGMRELLSNSHQVCNPKRTLFIKKWLRRITNA